VKEQTSLTIKLKQNLTPCTSIGFYILSSVKGTLREMYAVYLLTIPEGGRPLLAKKDILVKKSGFWENTEGLSP